jgi:hypothetical protein
LTSRVALLERLRATAHPQLGEALVASVDIRILLRRYPHWLAVVAPRSHAECWLDALNWAEVRARKVPASTYVRPKPPKWLSEQSLQRMTGLITLATMAWALWSRFKH